MYFIQESKNQTKLYSKKANKFILSIIFILIFTLLNTNYLLHALDIKNNNSRNLDTPIPDDNVDSSNWLLETESKFDDYLAYDNKLESILYKKNNNIINNNALAFNTMASLLALEKLGISHKITIDKNIAKKSSAENNFSFILSAGSTYKLEHLIRAIVFYDSKAAVEAVLNAISSSPNELIVMMKNRARSLGMDQTKIIYAKEQYFFMTDLDDYSLLLNSAYSNIQYRVIFETKNEIYLTDSGESFYLKNRMNYAWTISRDNVKGAMMAQSDSFMYIVYLVTGESYSTFLIQGINLNDQIKNISSENLLTQAIVEAYKINQAIFAHFEKTILVRNGDAFRTVNFKQNNLNAPNKDNNVQINLVYLNTIYYLKPVTVSEVSPTIQVQIKSNINLPINKGSDLGNISFYMPNNEIYKVSVGPENDIYSENTSVEKLFATFSKNENIIKLIIILLFIALLVIVIEIISLIASHIAIRKLNNINK